MARIFIGILAVLALIIAQTHFLGLNGLTMLTIPMTIYLGFSAIDKLRFKSTNDKRHE